MALSDCPKCWDTPCTCGHEYETYWTAESVVSQIRMLVGVLTVKRGINLDTALEEVRAECQRNGMR